MRPAAVAAAFDRAMNPAYAGWGSHSGSDSGPIHGSTSCSCSQPSEGATTATDAPDAFRQASITAASGLLSPSALHTPRVRRSAPTTFGDTR